MRWLGLLVLVGCSQSPCDVEGDWKELAVAGFAHKCERLCMADEFDWEDCSVQCEAALESVCMGQGIRPYLEPLAIAPDQEA